ncbi:hypothetical protein [Escherichia coli]|uniref:hypothetical protein n=1 Tax=Escherichia coli TaxID=562 RepID=UPI0012FF9A6F|nr:hypothetical protein [Escherichia coli]
MAEYYPAEYGKENFNCPRCGVYAQQHWKQLLFRPMDGYSNTEAAPMHMAICEHCDGLSFWFSEQMIVPAVTNGAIVIHTQRLKSDPGGNLLS